jgi:hypothetical protein
LPSERYGLKCSVSIEAEVVGSIIKASKVTAEKTVRFVWATIKWKDTAPWSLAVEEALF